MAAILVLLSAVLVARLPGVTNGTLVGAWLPAGELRVELLYRPPGFVAGCLAGALALALLVTVAVPPPAVGLRRPASYREARNLLD